MAVKLKISILFLFLLLFYCGCDNTGLNPNEYQEPGFSGTITFSGSIPPADSLRDLRLIAVPYYPIDSTFVEIFDKIINQGIIPFSEGLSGKVTPGGSFEYTLNVKPQTYFYVALVQNYGINFLTDWRVVSVYGYTSLSPNPVPITVLDGKMLQGINFIVDFYSLPTQPFKMP